MKLIVAIALVLSAQEARAAPVFLACVLTNNDNTPLAVDIQINEGAGLANISFPEDGSGFSYRAVFTPTEVSFNGWTVNRVNLSLKRDNSGLVSVPVSYGKCQIDKRQRAF